MRNIWLAPAGFAAAALVVAACGSSTSSGGSGGSGSNPSTAPAASTSSAPAAAGTALKTRKIGAVTVLTNAKGFTLYSFAPDSATQSRCNGACAHYWPPVPGPATAGPGVTGTLTVITRADGSKQAAWNGHPLYTYISDTAPGMARGNNLNISGGVWKEIALSGKAKKSGGSGGGGGGGGYGY